MQLLQYFYEGTGENQVMLIDVLAEIRKTQFHNASPELYCYPKSQHDLSKAIIFMKILLAWGGREVTVLLCRRKQIAFISWF
jgi:hypothetical protein